MGDATPGVLRYNPALDGVRGIAVLLVLANHFLARGDPNRGLVAIPFKLAQAGRTGVDLFFVLSGFLITSILWETRGNSRYFTAFYARRTLRIFPLYYGCLIVVLVVLPLFGVFRTPEIQPILDNQSYLWFYASNFCPVRLSMGWLHLGHFWSLAIEEQFYLFWPLILSRLSRQGCIRVAIAAILVSLLSRGALQALAAVDKDLAPMAARATFAWTFCRFDGLATGALIALWSTAPDWRRKLCLFVRQPQSLWRIGYGEDCSIGY
jgi:peptidoglycan/LPS O-acetylase OafA/YrhL